MKFLGVGDWDCNCSISPVCGMNFSFLLKSPGEAIVKIYLHLQNHFCGWVLYAAMNI